MVSYTSPALTYAHTGVAVSYPTCRNSVCLVYWRESCLRLATVTSSHLILEEYFKWLYTASLKYLHAPLFIMICYMNIDCKTLISYREQHSWLPYNKKMCLRLPYNKKKVPTCKSLQFPQTGFGNCAKWTWIRNVCVCSNIYTVQFSIATFTNVSMKKTSTFWDVTSCSPLNVNRSFGGTYSFHL
jgi:hypothetical protein